METEPVTNANDFIESLIYSYESRIRSIESVFFKSEAITQSSFNLLNDFNNSLKDYKTERNKINSQLQENLARNVSLRKKDYNRMMSDILNKLDEKEREAEKYFCQFIDEQKVMIQLLENGIPEIKNNFHHDNREKINTFRQELNRISRELETKKERVIRQLRDYQYMHQKTIEKLKMLLAKGGQIFIQDVKEVHRDLLSEMI
ncbi:MAG: hypothetical protein AB7D05_09495 [Mangrovibacterium sp.]